MKFEASQGSTQLKTKVQEILVVETDSKTTTLIRNSAEERGIKVRAVPDVQQAKLEMRQNPADLLVVNLQVGDNDGLALVENFRKQYPQTEMIAVSRVRNPELCLQAWRAGATDMLLGKVDLIDIRGCLDRVISRRDQKDQAAARNQRLRVVCRSLNKARHEISQQVNLLCHDLVRAYQELAEQLNQTQVSGEFSTLIGQEVEIESVMRRSMEWLLKKLGPVNAAVFLPDSEQNYSLGAYLNFDTSAESVLVDLVGQTVVAQAAEANSSLVVETDQQIRDQFGDEANMLTGRTWLSCGAFYQNECLAVIVVFRNQNDPLDPTWPALLESIAPSLAEKIARSIRVYQRGLHHDEDTENDLPDDNSDE